MLPSNSSAQCSFEIVITPPFGADPEDVHVIVYDGWDKLKHQGNGGATLTLPMGLYTVRWQYANQMGEQIVRLSSPTHRLELLIERQTPAPVPGATDTHEYYSALNQTVDASNQTGEPFGSSPYTSRLHLLIRARNRESYHGEDLSAGLRLLDQDLKHLFYLSERSWLNTNDGFLLCSLEAAPGFYFIEYRPRIVETNNLPRLFPVHLFPYWQTRIFVYQAYCPLFESASVNMVRLSYNQDNIYEREEGWRVNAAADAALNALQNNLDDLPREIERALLMGKFENPLLGLLGTHLLLRHSDFNKPDLARIQRSHSVNTLRDILGNLQWLLPNSPDVAALLFRAAQISPENNAFPHPAPVRYLPMLRSSLEMLLDADSESVVAIDDGSPLAQLAPDLYYDSPWASFRPPIEPRIEGAEEISKGVIGLESLHIPYFIQSEKWDDNSWLEDSVKDILQTTGRTGRDPDWSRLAAGLGVTYRKMMKTVQLVKGWQGPESYLGSKGFYPDEPPKLPTT